MNWTKGIIDGINNRAMETHLDKGHNFHYTYKKSKAEKRRVILYETNRELSMVKKSSGVIDETSLGAAYGSYANKLRKNSVC